MPVAERVEHVVEARYKLPWGELDRIYGFCETCPERLRLVAFFQKWMAGDLEGTQVEPLMGAKTKCLIVENGYRNTVYINSMRRFRGWLWSRCEWGNPYDVECPAMKN
jgi:hypothetical protein